MYYLLSLFSGVIIAVSVFFNGSLSEHHGIHLATVIIHFTGLMLVATIALVTRARPFAKMQKWYLYLGGAMGILTILSNNISFGRISLSAIMALVLFGQSLSGLVVDQFGWMGMQKHPFNGKRIIGLLLTLGGIAVMIDRFDFLAVIVSFLAGINIVVSRTLNGRLAELTNVRTSTFFNYLVGFAVSIPVFLTFGLWNNGGADVSLSISPNVYMYFGGILGACIILITNYVVAKIPSLYLTLLAFAGQVFTGVLIDTLAAQSFSPRILTGGIMVTAGLCTDMLFDRKKKQTSLGTKN